MPERSEDGLRLAGTTEALRWQELRVPRRTASEHEGPESVVIKAVVGAGAQFGESELKAPGWPAGGTSGGETGGRAMSLGWVHNRQSTVCLEEGVSKWV